MMPFSSVATNLNEVAGAMVSRRAFRVEQLVEVNELTAAEPEWMSLVDFEPSPMESFGWSLAAAKSMTGDQTPRVIKLTSHGDLHGMAPLARMHKSWTGRLEILGMRRLNEPGDLLARDLSSRRELVRQVLRLSRPLTIDRIGVESPSLAILREMGPRYGWTVVRPRASCPVITLDESWREPESHLSPRRRSDFRRSWRRAEKLGAVRVETLTPSLDELDGLLDTAFAIEAKSWKGAAGTALAQDPVRGRFMREYCRWACRVDVLRICLLSIAEQPIAMQIAAEQSGGLWLLKIGFDPEFACCSPGILLLADSIRYAAERRLRSFEFLGTAEKWTRVWTEQERQCVSVRHYPYGINGIAALAADCAAAAYSRLRRRMHVVRNETLIEETE